MDEKDIIKAVINYIVPVLLTAVVAFVKPVGDMTFWVSTLLSWRGLAVLASCVATLVIFPKALLWVLLVALAVVAGERVWFFVRTPGDPRSLLFVGFYSIAPGNKLVRLPQTGAAEMAFCNKLRRDLTGHCLKGSLAVHVKDHRYPPLVFAHLTLEAFRGLINRQAKKCVGVVWGLVDATGRVQHFELCVDPANCPAGVDTLKLIGDVAKVISPDGPPTVASVELCASLLAALLSQSSCDVLNSQGQWRESIAAAIDSTGILVRALEEYSACAGASAQPIIDFVHRRYMPVLIRQQALGLFHGKEWVPALEKLHAALLIDPLTPLSATEFAEFYSARYAWDLLGNDLMDPEIARARPWVAEKARLHAPPSLHLYVQWIRHVSRTSRDLNEVVEGHFRQLAAAHKENPYVFAYWGDAVKAAGQRPGEDGEKERLPRSVMESAMKKYEIALQLDPHLSVIAIRLAAMAALHSGYFEPGSREHVRALKSGQRFAHAGRNWWRETFPMLIGQRLPDEDKRVERNWVKLQYLFEPESKWQHSKDAKANENTCQPGAAADGSEETATTK